MEVWYYWNKDDIVDDLDHFLTEAETLDIVSFFMSFPSVNKKQCGV